MSVNEISTLVIGTSSAEGDIDYECDGVDDDVEINAAIAALPPEGGEIVILEGTYNLSAYINLNKNNITLKGIENETVLKAVFNNTSTSYGVITCSGSDCTIKDLTITNPTENNQVIGIRIGGSNSKEGINNAITDNICSNKSNNASYGIYISSNNNIATDNTCSNTSSSNASYGIYISGNYNTVTDNECSNISNSNSSCGVRIGNSNNIVSGNTRSNGSGGSYGIHVSGDYNTITDNECSNSSNTISYSVYISSSGNNNIVTGNTC